MKTLAGRQEKLADGIRGCWELGCRGERVGFAVVLGGQKKVEENEVSNPK